VVLRGLNSLIRHRDENRLRDITGRRVTNARAIARHPDIVEQVKEEVRAGQPGCTGSQAPAYGRLFVTVTEATDRGTGSVRRLTLPARGQFCTPVPIRGSNRQVPHASRSGEPSYPIRARPGAVTA